MSLTNIHESLATGGDEGGNSERRNKLIGWASEIVKPEFLFSSSIEESVAGALAEKFGLSFSNENAQNFAYVISFAAVMELSYHVIGVGASFSSIDMTGLALAQIKKTLEDIKKMIGVILAAPLKTAIDKTATAMNLLQNEQVDEAIEEFRGVKTDAHTAFHYASDQGKDVENLRQVVTAKKILILAKLCIYSYDKTSGRIDPFYVLDKKRQKAVANEVERDCRDVIEFHKAVKPSGLINRSKKQKKIDDLKNALLQIAYPYISEGSNWTNATDVLYPGEESVQSFEFEKDLVPEGMEFRTTVKIGSMKGGNGSKFVNLCMWKDHAYVYTSILVTTKTDLSLKNITVNVDPDPLIYKIWWPDSSGYSDIEFVRTKYEFVSRADIVYMGIRYGLFFKHQLFFLYKADDNCWYISNKVGSKDEKDLLSMRNLNFRNDPSPPYWPPLTGWEYKRESEWQVADGRCTITQPLMQKESDTSVEIHNRSGLNFKRIPDKLCITGSKRNYYGGGVYHASFESAYKKSIVYAQKGGEDQFCIYKGGDGAWYCNKNRSLGENDGLLRNKSQPDSEIPPAKGWEKKETEDKTWEPEETIEVHHSVLPL